MLLFRARRATIIRIPSLALMVSCLWLMAEAPSFVGGRLPGRVTWGFALVVATLLVLGGKIIRRVDDVIVLAGIFGRRSIPARHAALGIRMRGGGRYWGLDLELMRFRTLDGPNPLTIDSFQPNGIDQALRAGRRMALLLRLPEPMLGPGLVDTAPSTPTQPDTGLRVRDFGLRKRSSVVPAWTKFLALAGLASVIWMVFAPRHDAKLVLRCGKSTYVRGATFNYTCVGRSIVDVDAGPTVLGVWSPTRACWVEHRFVVPEHRRIAVDVDLGLETRPCVDPAWPPPP